MRTGGISMWTSSLRALAQHQQDKGVALERLSTGKQVNRASDDPSGLVASENMNARQAEISKLLDGFDRESARLGATEGGLSVIQDMVIELNGLVVSTANTAGLSDAEREAVGVEIKSVLDAINHIATTTMFDGNQVLIGNDTGSLGLGDLMLKMTEDPEAAQKAVEAATDHIAGKRGAIGNRLRAIDHESNALQEEFAANAGVISSIVDTDYAKESAALVRGQILEQATTKAILIEREQSARILDLLQPGLSERVVR